MYEKYGESCEKLNQLKARQAPLTPAQTAGVTPAVAATAATAAAATSSSLKRKAGGANSDATLQRFSPAYQRRLARRKASCGEPAAAAAPFEALLAAAPAAAASAATAAKFEDEPIAQVESGDGAA